MRGIGLEVRGLEEVQRLLRRLAEEAPRAAIRAQNQMAYQLREGMMLQVAADFDRPKAYTRSAIRYSSATLGQPRSRVFVRSDDGSLADEQHYLGVQVLGGARRRLRKSEQVLQARGLMPAGYVWVPTRFTRLDAYGNVPAALISAILGTGPNAGRVSDKYLIVGDPGQERGVWERFPDGRVLPILLFVPPRQYRERFDFYGRAEREIDARLIPLLEAALTEALDAADRG